MVSVVHASVHAFFPPTISSDRWLSSKSIDWSKCFQFVVVGVFVVVVVFVFLFNLLHTTRPRDGIQLNSLCTQFSLLQFVYLFFSVTRTRSRTNGTHSRFLCPCRSGVAFGFSANMPDYRMIYRKNKLSVSVNYNVIIHLPKCERAFQDKLYNPCRISLVSATCEVVCVCVRVFE